MALSLSATLTFTASQVTLTNTTGDYNVSTNPTGYGTPNPAFNALAHYAIIRKKNVNDVADEVLTLDSYNVITAESFTCDRAIDGWYEGTLIDILIWTAGTYASGYVVYYNGVIYQSNTSTTGTPGVSGDWDVVTDLTEIEDNDTVYTYAIGRTTAYDADTYWSKQIAQNSQRGRCGICDDDRQKDRLDKIEFHINCVLVADQLGNNQDAEWNVLTLIDLGAVAE
jgi:hypothetical protein